MEDIIFEITTEKKDDKYAKFVIGPLVSGFGHTLGNSLRRVLLTSLPGAAITNVHIKGAKHQFSTIKGVSEDVLDFLLNLKKVRFNYSGDEPVKLSLIFSKAGEVKAKDIKTPANVEIANPDLVLANLSKGAKLELEMELGKGFGYVDAESNKKEGIGNIPLDASFSPIEKVNFKVEETRVGRLTDYDKLILEIFTDGTVDAYDALKEASRILLGYFNQIVSPKKAEKVVKLEKDDSLGSIGKLSVEEIGLPTRVANALSKAGFDTVESLVKANREDLVKVRNLGEKSLKIIDIALKEKGVEINA